MIQSERRRYLIEALLNEEPQYKNLTVPNDEYEQKQLLRALFNLRLPKYIDKDFLEVQDDYLKEEIAQKGITEFKDLIPIRESIYLWKGDITTIRCDAIVNAANSKMLGCFHPGHGCIDNVIHTFAGIQLRTACAEIMNKQGHDEKTGMAKITPAFNLPCKYILHTVGPIIKDKATNKDEELLASCYRSCLELADKYNLKNIAFCCISTGEFRFPNDRAAEIAIKTVNEYKVQTKSKIEVIFNVFKEIDYNIYRELLTKNQ